MLDSHATATAPRMVPLQPRMQLSPAHLIAAAAQQQRIEAAAAKSSKATATGKTNKKAARAATTDAASPLSASARTRMMKKCTIPLCGSYARSRGLCKAHGGGKRCNHPGCEVSDQGGGFCIKHGGGKRCAVEGCTKSAQSRQFCKAHGGGARCVVKGCHKSSQGGGLCRGHGGGPRRKKVVNARGEVIESPRSKARAKFRAQVAARALVHAANAIEGETEARSPTSPTASASWASQESMVECEPGTTGALSFKIRPLATPKPTPSESDEAQDKSEATSVCGVGGCRNRVSAALGQACEEHSTHFFVATSLLNMQTAAE